MIGRSAIMAGAAALLAAGHAAARPPRYDLKRDVVLEQRLRGQVPLNVAYLDEGGRDVTLGTYFRGRPVALMLPFYQCAGICTAELNGLVRALRVLDLRPGLDFEIVVASINPTEKPPLAAMKKQAYLAQLGRPEAGDGWHFLTGPEPSTKTLTGAVGYHYVHDAETDQYIHPPGLIIITPQGRISRVFTGVEYDPRTLRLSLVEASAGKIGTRSEQVLLACYQFDPAKGRYTLAVGRLLQIGGALTLAALVGFISLSVARDRRSRGRQVSRA